MEQINLEQTEFRSESDLKSYLVSLVLEYASTMNRIEIETFLKQEAGKTKSSDLFEEYKQKYLPVFTAIVQTRNEPMADKPVLLDAQLNMTG